MITNVPIICNLQTVGETLKTKFILNHMFYSILYISLKV